jgi:hypothetical protein
MSENINSFVMPSSPDDRKKIMAAMNEISASMTRIEGEKSYIKETISDLEEKYQIPKKMLNRFAKAHHKANYHEVIGADEEFQTMCETLVNID